MKVIAKISDGLLLSATMEEIGNLLGHRHFHHTDVPNIGDSINVPDVFAYGGRHDNLRQQSKGLAKQLRAAADVLEERVEPLTRAITENDGEAAVELTNP